MYMIWFDWVWFYSISTIVGYLMPIPLYTYILNVYDLVWFGLVLWHINHCRLFNAKSSLYIYIKYIWFGLVLWHINNCRLFNAKSSFYIYILNIWFVNTFCRFTQLNDQTLLILTIQLTISQKKLNSSKYCYVSLTIQSNISYLFTYS